MFNLLQYASRKAIVTDRGEILTYLQLNNEVELFHKALPAKGFLFILSENLLGALVGYVAAMKKHIPSVLLNGCKDLELVQQLISIYHPEYLWIPTRRVNEIGGKTIYEYGDFSLQMM